MAVFLAVGCYNKGPYTPEPQKDSVFIVKLDTIKESEKLSVVSKYDDLDNASYFARSDDRIRRFEARSIDCGKIEQTPLLEFEKKIDFDDGGACFLSVENLMDETKRIAVACYDSGVLRTFRSNRNELNEEARIKFEYCVDEASERQEAPHAHCVVKVGDEEGALALVDLGADRVYQVKASVSALSVVPEAHFSAPPKSGPRHLVFHPTKFLGFLILELSNEILVVSGDLSKSIQRISLLDPPGNTVNEPSCEIQAAAHLAISNDGKFVLCSNRGKINNIIVFKIDENTGKLEFVDCLKTGNFPRFFQLVEDRFLIVANQKTNNLQVFSFDQGKIGKTSLSNLELISPVCIQIL